MRDSFCAGKKIILDGDRCYAGNLLEDGWLANQTERRVVGTAIRRFIPQMNVVSTSKTPQQHVTR